MEQRFSRVLFVCVAVVGLLLLTSAAGASAETAEAFDYVGGDDVTIDVTKDTPPAVTLELQHDPGVAPPPEVVVTTHAGPQFAQVCDFTAATGLPDNGATAEVSFSVRDEAACDLAATALEKVSLRSVQIDDLSLEANLKRDPTFPLEAYVPKVQTAWAIAALVWAASVIAAYLRWRQDHKDRANCRRFLGHSLDTATLKWSFSESWLTNLTALGAIVATVLAATDVLDVVGPSKADRAVFLFLNIAGLAIAATALISYLACRGYKHSTRTPRSVNLRLNVVTSFDATSSERTLTASVPTFNHEYQRVGDDLPTTKEWQLNSHHQAVLTIPSFPATVPPTCISLEVPEAGSHDPVTHFLYSVPVPLKPATAGAEEPTESSTVYEARGRMVGFILAGLLASLGLATQLGSLAALVDSSTLDESVQTVALLVIAGMAVFAAAYVITTMFNRIQEVDNPADKLKASEVDLPLKMVDECGKVPSPIAPTAIISQSASGLSADEFAALDTLLPLVAPAYPYPGTSPGDEPSREVTVSTAF